MRFWIVIVLILVLSALGLTYEIAAGRVLAPYFGTSLLTWTAVIATVLGGFSLGAAWGGFVAERPRGRAIGIVRTALVGTAVLMALTPAALGLLNAMGARGTGGMLFSVVLAIFPASVLVSLPSPLLAKLAVEARPGREGSSLGLVLAAGSLGGIVGAILAGFVALPLIGSAATFAACGAVALGCLILLGRGSGGGDPAAPRAIVAAAWGFVAISALVGRSVCDFESGLSCLHVERDGDEIRLYSDRTLQAAERLGPTEGSTPDLALSYTQWLQARLERDLGEAPTVLFVGGGGYTLPTALLAARPAARAVVVEIDPLVTQVARAHLPQAGEMLTQAGVVVEQGEVEPPARLHIVHADGRVYLNQTQRRFDAAVMDAFSSSTVPAHLVTRESFARLRAIVDGPVYVNLIDRPDGPLVRGVHAILASLWPQVVAVQGPVSGRGLSNILLSASQAPLAELPAMPEGYAHAAISPSRAFTDDRGWVGHR